ncbi:MAG: 2-oxoacid:acceptor oxidoreductase family protein [Chitinispirillales bacterium]|jgi:2-oxoglutarate ferredoxin oxidoreductase subunit alpha|nr:2-oxoacid:acceptor oxidoreductase family protein [Chitinispirillales bacterium]
MKAAGGDDFFLRILFSGEAGDGILSAGETLMDSAARLGLWTSVHKNFPPTIRGGFCSALVTISDSADAAPVSSFANFFFQLDKALLTISSINGTDNTKSFSLPYNNCAHIISHPPLKSSFALGLICKILDIPSELILSCITQKKTLGGENKVAFENGQKFAEEKFDLEYKSIRHIAGEKKIREKLVILDGNDAVALGALSANCGFYASYPITPATSIGECLSRYLPHLGGCVYQAEDEIAAIGAVIGAYANGKRAMTATSGPGLSLMQEFLGYCSMTELPAVVVDVQRVGPSTGMPTKHSQDDLFAAALGGHGEGQRIVLAAANIEECFYLTMEAFNLAENYQCPVILLSDSALGHLRSTCKRPDPYSILSVEREGADAFCDDNGIYKRYSFDLIRTPALPVPGISSVNSRITGLEHDPYGLPVNGAQNRAGQQNRRFRKMDDINEKYNHLQIWDTDNLNRGEADLCVVSWGLSALMTRLAVASLRRQGVKIACLYPKLLFPLDKELYLALQDFCPRVAVVESNYTGQLASLIRMYAGVDTISITKCCGDPFCYEEIEDALNKIFTESCVKI